MTNNKKKESKGVIISCVGGLFTIIGVALISIGGFKLLSYISLILGVILAAYGVLIMEKMKNN